MSILLNTNVAISNEPFKHIYSINIAMLESAMNDNSFCCQVEAIVVAGHVD